jgi:trimethylguanosine synthase
MSFFSSLPPQLKYQLRSQPKLELEPAPAEEEVKNVHVQPKLSDLLPTQPPMEDDDDGDEYEDAEEGGGEEGEEEEVMELATPAATALPGPSSMPASTVSTVVISRKRAHSVEARPSHTKRRKGKGKAIDEHNAYEGHSWDCTGLVPRYTDASEVPKHLKKCKQRSVQHAMS